MAKKDKPISPIWFHEMRIVLVNVEIYNELKMADIKGIHDFTILDAAELASELIKAPYKVKK